MALNLLPFADQLISTLTNKDLDVLIRTLLLSDHFVRITS